VKKKRWFEQLDHEPRQLRQEAGRGCLMAFLAAALILLFLIALGAAT
jgi:hypothetical protein